MKCSLRTEYADGGRGDGCAENVTGRTLPGSETYSVFGLGWPWRNSSAHDFATTPCRYMPKTEKSTLCGVQRQELVKTPYHHEDTYSVHITTISARKSLLYRLSRILQSRLKHQPLIDRHNIHPPKAHRTRHGHSIPIKATGYRLLCQ